MILVNIIYWYELHLVSYQIIGKIFLVRKNFVGEILYFHDFLLLFMSFILIIFNSLPNFEEIVFYVYFDYVFLYLKKTHKNYFCKLLLRTAEKVKFLDGLCVPSVFFGHVLNFFWFLFVIISSSNGLEHTSLYITKPILKFILYYRAFAHCLSWLCFN